MDRHRVAQIVEGDAALQRHREPLQDLVGALAQQMDADDAAFFAHADQLEQTALRRIGQCVQHRPEPGAISPHRIAVLGARVLFAQAHAGQRRMREDHGWNVLAIEQRRGAGIEPIHQPTRGGNRHRGQRRVGGDIADRIHAVDIGRVGRVHDDAALVVKHNARRFQTQIIGIRAPTGREQQRVEALAHAAGHIAQAQAFAVYVAFHRFQSVTEMQLHAGLSVILGQLRGEFGVESVKQAVAAAEHLDPAAQRLQHAGQFDRDVTGTHNRHPRRRRGPVEKIVGHAAQFGAGHIGTMRSAAGGDQQPLAAHRDAVGADHGVRVAQPHAAGGHHDAGLIEPAAITFVDVVDVTLAMDDERRPVQFGRRQIEAERPRQFDLRAHIGRQPHRFFRHAADVDAGAAQRIGFAQRHAGAVFGGAERCGQAAGAAADHDQVVVRFGIVFHANRSGR